MLAALNKQLIEDERHRNPMSLDQLTQRMAGWLAGDYRAAVFQEDETVVGYALVRPEAQHLYIRQFFIQRTHRRRGLGTAAIQWLRRQTLAGPPGSPTATDPAAPADSGPLRLRIDVLIGNTQAIAFWRAIGFHDYCLTMEMDGDAPGAPG